ncbi:MAG TPA: hypothetical protein VK783_13360 [Bacteroidia bacterium]|jgi:hypothetical protein|nr:hypothetical protein [Bacteroidia bacterium]
MKKVILAFITGLIIITMQERAYSQTDLVETVINMSAGYSAVSNPSSVTTGKTNGAVCSPVINGTLDFPVSNKFTLGISIAYQSFNGTFSTTYYTNFGVPYTGTYTDNTNVTNFGFRVLEHFGSEKLNGYGGLRIGYSSWSETSSGNAAYGVNNLGAPTIMAILGLRANITSLLAIHIELGLGSPYVFETGISFCFGGKHWS